MSFPVRIAVVTEGTGVGPLVDLLGSADGDCAVSVYAGRPGEGGAPPGPRGDRVRRYHPTPSAGAGAPDLPAFLLGPEGGFVDNDVVVLLEDASPAVLVAVACREKFGKKLVLLAHEERFFPRVRPADARAKALRAIVHRTADAVLAVTERARDVIAVEGVSSERIAVISPGVDTARFAPGGPGGDATPRRNVLFVGRLEWDDGIFDLLHAAKLIDLTEDRAGAPVSYTVVGGGSERARVREAAADLGLAARVRFVDGTAGFGSPETYRGADVLVMPAMVPRPWTDGSGWSLPEAMACGIAIVAAHSGSVPEIVADAGILVPPADPGVLARELTRVLRDDALRADLALRARRRAVERFDAGLAARRLGDLFRGLVRG